MSDKPAFTASCLPMCSRACTRSAPRSRPRANGPPASISPASWSSRRAMPRHGDLATNAAMVLAKDAEDEAARARREDRGKAARRRSGRRRRGRRARLHQSDARSLQVWADVLRTDAARRRGLRQERDRQRRARSMSNTSRPIRPGRCMSAIAAARCSAMRSPICSPSPATRSRANITSTTPAPRSTCSPARPSCATARRSARTSARSRKGSIPATI